MDFSDSMPTEIILQQRDGSYKNKNKKRSTVIINGSFTRDIN